MSEPVAAADPQRDSVEHVADVLALLANRHGSGPVFVHSDPFRSARLVPGSRDRVALLDSHLALLALLAAERPLWLPAFNYDYPKTHRFDAVNDPVQLGPIPERFRTARAEWRTPVPIFSACGTGADPDIRWGQRTDPFGSGSIFDQLVASDGTVLFYGETFHYTTLIHFSERQAGGPPYRYDKLFPGAVMLPDGREVPGSLVYHVRPLGSGLDYDWPRLLADAEQEGVCARAPGYPEVLAASARRLNDFFIAAMRGDPLALLDARTRKWVEPALDTLGRRFLISDFEAPEPLM